VRHKGCWASDSTKTFKNTTLEVYVKGWDEDSYDVWAIYKHDKGVIPKNVQIDIIDFISNHDIVHHCDRQADFEDKILWLDVVVRDRGKKEGIIRPVLFSDGQIITELGLSVRDGEELVTGLFMSKENFAFCDSEMKRIYKEDYLKSTPEKPSTLCDCAPLLLETLARRKLPLHRKRLAEELFGRKSTISSENWTRHIAAGLRDAWGAVIAKLIVKLIFGVDP